MRSFILQIFSLAYEFLFINFVKITGKNVYMKTWGTAKLYTLGDVGFILTAVRFTSWFWNLLSDGVQEVEKQLDVQVTQTPCDWLLFWRILFTEQH